MFQKTNNPYRLRYLVTSIKGGEGIKEVYLPPVPPDEQILFKKEQLFVTPEIPKHLKSEIKKIGEKLDEKSDKYDPYYTSPYQSELDQFIDKEFEKFEKGVWFWNDGEIVYITGDHYKYLVYWNLYFGRPSFRDPDKEIFYLIKFMEYDPDSFGILLNTIRRYGKSAIIGFWLWNRTATNFNFIGGCQGEKEGKIEPFYNTFILQPFLKLPFFLQPRYDTSTTQSTGIEFKPTSKRGRKTSYFGAEEDYLNSSIDYRTSGESEYDQAVLHSYVGEELGKTLTCNVDERWKFVKPCLKRGIFIRGKAIGATTVEFMDSGDKGGQAYKKMAYESDYNDRQPDGRTITGLYFVFLPGDCALEGFFDAWGRPMREKARRYILNEREGVKKNPKDLASLIRKYPLTVREIFYVNTERCEFNAIILQTRNEELESMVQPSYSRFDLFWENNVRFTKVKYRHNPTGGWLKAAWMPTNIIQETNQVEERIIGGVKKYSPKADGKFDAGIDPIDHGVVVEAKTNAAEDEFRNSRRSRPVMLIKTKYDSKLDGPITQEILEKRAEERYQYNSNKYVMMMDVRPNDPNVLYERALMICWFCGVSLHVESQRAGIIRYFYQQNCENFILQKYVPFDSKQKKQFDDGTPASLMTIQEYTGDIATYVEYFGHTIPFPELIEDLLLFNPRKTTEFDYTVAMGYTELATKMRPKITTPPILDLDQFMPSYNPYTGERRYRQNSVSLSDENFLTR